MNFSSISARGAIGKALRFPLSLIPKNAVFPVLQGALRGKRWVVGSGNHGCWLGSYELDKQKMFIEHIKKGDVVYDIGAHAGFYTLISSVLVGAAGRVFAFEPLPTNIGYLKRHLALNNVTNVVLHEKAVSNYEGKADFFAHESTFIGHLARANAAVSTKAIQVDVIALDAFVKAENLPAPHIIKVDIEGAELDFLKGATTLLQNNTPKLFLATHGRVIHAECLAFLRGLNYQISSLDHLPVEDTSEILAVKQP
jgi:FkbM family methyltransferase